MEACVIFVSVSGTVFMAMDGMDRLMDDIYHICKWRKLDIVDIVLKVS
jgi:hypothetical protein